MLKYSILFKDLYEGAEFRTIDDNPEHENYGRCIKMKPFQRNNNEGLFVYVNAWVFEKNEYVFIPDDCVVTCNPRFINYTVVKSRLTTEMEELIAQIDTTIENQKEHEEREKERRKKAEERAADPNYEQKERDRELLKWYQFFCQRELH